MVKNTIPAYENPKERDMMLRKQYHILQRRFYEERRTAEEKRRTEKRSERRM
ncbi:MAG: hypothetical protein NC409_12250 [Clostridium sp.]|nr:hypothetical protein [Clostridium sp.]